ncbi:MAG: TPM domain-containing protein [Planctomycetes bacterium]|jgi:uncharacterized protein|nr:TPM domain-containing protein [Planctomycetota bacterium]
MVRHGLLLLLLFAAPLAARIELEPPGQREFVLDRAGLLDERSVQAIRQICDSVLRERGIPIVVVTIETIQVYGGDMSIERFATALYNQWGVGHPTIHGKPWNKGMLVIVSAGDRKARIELGAGWESGHDAQCRRVMDEFMVPRFRKGDYAGGLVAGVEQLATMARGEQLPAPPFPWQAVLLAIGFFALMVWTGVSLYRRGRSGWAWVFWGVVFTVLGFLLMALLSGRRRSGFSGGFGGGSFGGGFSRGGGASGSW